MNPIIMPIRTVSLANQREHWTKRAKRAKAERELAYLMMPPKLPFMLPCTIKLTRMAPRELDDDNLRGSFKSIRDGIADRFGVDDRDKRIKWDYAQEYSAPKLYAVRVEVL